MVVNHTTVVRAKRNDGNVSLPSKTNNFRKSFWQTRQKITVKKTLYNNTSIQVIQTVRNDGDRQKYL